MVHDLANDDVCWLQPATESVVPVEPEESEPVVNTKTSSKASKRVCVIDGNDGKYECPKCQQVTCSLNCVKEHKRKFNCDGIRSRVEAIARADMDVAMLQKDCELLQDSATAVESAARVRVNSLNKPTTKLSNDPAPPIIEGNASLSRVDLAGSNAWMKYGSRKGQMNAMELRKSASVRGITVMTAPLGMTARNENSTGWINTFPKAKTGGRGERTAAIGWKVRWVLEDVNGDAPMLLLDPRRSELASIANTIKAMTEDSWKPKGMMKPLVLKHLIPGYATTKTDEESPCEGYSHIRAFLEIPKPIRKELGGGMTHWRLDIDKSLKDSLRGRVIIEHPTIILGCRGDASDEGKVVCDIDYIGEIEPSTHNVPPATSPAIEHPITVPQEAYLQPYQPPAPTNHPCVGSKWLERIPPPITTPIRHTSPMMPPPPVGPYTPPPQPPCHGLPSGAYTNHPPPMPPPQRMPPPEPANGVGHKWLNRMSH